VGENDPTVRCLWAGEARQFLHQEFIGQTVEAVSANTRRLVASRNRKEARYPRQVAMERGVEACDLWHVGKSFSQSSDETDFRRQVFGCKWADPTQLVYHLQVYDLGFRIARAAMHHAMANRAKAPRRGRFRKAF